MAKINVYGKEWLAQYLGFDVNDAESWKLVEKVLSNVDYKWSVLPCIVHNGKDLMGVYETLGMSYNTARTKFLREALLCRRFMKSIRAGETSMLTVLHESTMSALVNAGVDNLKDLEFWKAQDIIDLVGEEGFEEILTVCDKEGIAIKAASEVFESGNDCDEDTSLDSALSRLSNV